MSAIILDGRSVAKTIREEVQAEIAAFRAAHGQAPGLAVVQVEGDAASAQ